MKNFKWQVGPCYISTWRNFYCIFNCSIYLIYNKFNKFYFKISKLMKKVSFKTLYKMATIKFQTINNPFSKKKLMRLQNTSAVIGIIKDSWRVAYFCEYKWFYKKISRIVGSGDLGGYSIGTGSRILLPGNR